MATNVKKNGKINALLACVLTFIISLTLSVFFFLKPTNAYASNGGSVFVIEQGAGVKLTQNGLRFIVKMDEGYYQMIQDENVELWGYIAPVEEFDKVTEYRDLNVKVGGALKEEKIYKKGGYYYANIAMTDLDKYTSGGVNLYEKSFSATFFIVDKRNGSPVYTYAKFAQGENGVPDIDLQNRTQYSVLCSALLDGEKNFELKILNVYEWLGSEDYPIIVSTQSKYDALVQKLANYEFKTKMQGKHVFIHNDVSANDSTVSSTCTVSKGFKVTYLDGYSVVAVDFVENGKNSTLPSNPTKEGFEFVGWSGVTTKVSEDRNIYATWKSVMGDAKDIGNMKVYGVSRADGLKISADDDVIGQKVTLASGYLDDGAYYPGDGNPTDKTNSANQAYLAFDGEYSFGDFFVADFTGKNMPTIAFFANNYNNSIFYGNGNKKGIVVSTGLTLPDGRLFTEGAGEKGEGPYSTTVWDGYGLALWGPRMIYSTGKNGTYETSSLLLHSNETNVALGRANLVDGKKYRVIMGFEETNNDKIIKLVYTLYDLDNDCVVEMRSVYTYGHFSDKNTFCKGSIVAYGYFGTQTVLDKVYNIYQDTTIKEISNQLGMSYVYNNNYKNEGDKIILQTSTLGNNANYTKGQQAATGAWVDQSCYTIDGNYGLNDYVAFDFTGKNMPEIAFFAKNYDNSMYASGTSKQGIVVVTGITKYDGSLGSGVNGNGTIISYGYAHMIADTAGHKDFLYDGSKNIVSALGRANLDDATRYRVIMGFVGGSGHGSNGVTLKWNLYNLDTNEIVEQGKLESYNFFTGSNSAVGNLTLKDLVGSIVLYGKFGTTCTIDKLYGVYEDTTIEHVAQKVSAEKVAVTFKNYDGEILLEQEVLAGEIPTYSGIYPEREEDFIATYTFAGWDKELTAVNEDTEYVATFNVINKDNVTVSGNQSHTYGVEQTSGKIVLKKSNLGQNANYTKGQNNASGAWVYQSYLALDGNYSLNDFVAFDFTGKNMPEIAFFAKNYDDSMYASGTSKQGIVVVTGITKYDGSLESGVNGNGTQINFGHPFMIQDASNGGFCQGAFANSQLGRANLVDGTHYRVIMGFTAYGASAVELKWCLYNLDTNEIVEENSMHSWNFFTGSDAAVGNMTLSDLVGSIVLYGKFGATCTIDKVHGVFEDTDIATVADGLKGNSTYTVTFKDGSGNNLQQSDVAFGSIPSYNGKTPSKESDYLFDYEFAGWDKSLSIVTENVVYTATFTKVAKDGIKVDGVTANGETIVLGSGNIGAGANYTIGQNAGGSINQTYLAFDGNYSFSDYIAFDFTGKNMPEIMFFAKNYDTSMYYSEGKQGVVVASGITLYNGTIGNAQTNNTKVGVSGPFGAYYSEAVAPYGGNMLKDFESKLARAKLEDGVQYRIIIGIEKGSNTFTVKWLLYNVTSEEIVEEVSQVSWAFFTGSNEAVNNMVVDDLSGSIVLYGKFGTTCTIDKIYGVYENSTLDDLKNALIGGEENPPEVPSDNAPDYSKYTDQFDFYAYGSYSNGYYELGGEQYYVGKNLANLKQYSLYGEAGMTIYFPQNSVLVDNSKDSLEKVKKLLKDLAEVGIYKTILQDSRILYLSMLQKAIVGSGCQFANEDALDEYIYNCVKDYATLPGVYGVQLGDEPRYACLPAYSAIYNSIKRVNTKYGYNLFIQYNLNPLNVSQNVYENYYPEVEGTYSWNSYMFSPSGRFNACVKRYTKYIKDFLDAMQPDYIMYDDYPLHVTKNGQLQILDSYIPCLQLIASIAAERNIKVYNVTQAFQNNSDGSSTLRREMTEKGAKWLNNILVGFGTKQIAYYTYYTRSQSNLEGNESYVDGQSFVDYNGNPTSLYYWMQKIMANNQKFAPTVMQFNYKGSKVYGSTSANHLSKISVSNTFEKLAGFSVSTGSALVTELYDAENANYMYMAMNVADPDVGDATHTVSMTFNGFTKVLVYVDGVATSQVLSGNVYTAKLNAGDAVYVIPYN